MGAVLGGVLFVVFPLAGIAGGAAIGGLIGRAAAPGIDGKWVKEVGDDPAGGSALFLQIRGGETGLALSGSISTRAGSSRPLSRTNSGPPVAASDRVSSTGGMPSRPGPQGTPEDALSLSEPAASATPSGGPDAPRLSILVPTWNAATTVERALESVLAERVILLEVVVVDDASTDGTANLVAAIAERGPRVVLLRLPANGGVSNARNRGLEFVRGEWLAFLDADDLLLPGALDALMGPTADPTVRAVVGQRDQNNGERRWISKGYDNPDVRIPGRNSFARTLASCITRRSTARSSIAR